MGGGLPDSYLDSENARQQHEPQAGHEEGENPASALPVQLGQDVGGAHVQERAGRYAQQQRQQRCCDAGRPGVG